MQLTRMPPAIGTLRPDLPAPLAGSIDRLLAKAPADRFPSGEALAEALDALRLAQPEVAPAIRVYRERANQAVRAIVILSLMFIAVFPQTFSVDRLVFCVMLAAFVWGFLIQLVGRTRYLLRQGFGYADVRAGYQAIAAEGEATRAQIRSVPAEFKRWRKVLRGAYATGIFGALNFLYTMTHSRVARPDGTYTISRPGLITIIACVVLMALAFVAIMTSPLRRSPLDLIDSRVFGGPIGRWLFRLAGWRMPAADVAAGAISSAANTARGPLTALEELAPAVRRQLGGVKDRIEKLEGEVEKLGRREIELARALREAETVTVAGLGEWPDPRRSAILDELAQSRKQTAERRQALVQGLEHIRLQLLRVRTGLGTPADVEAEVARVEAAAARG
jgi:serine/threonine-protein kinase